MSKTKSSVSGTLLEEKFSRLVESLTQSKQLASEVDLFIESDLQKIINKINEMTAAGKLHGWQSSSQWCG